MGINFYSGLKTVCTVYRKPLDLHPADFRHILSRISGWGVQKMRLASSLDLV
jgi:hypothetical protein